MQRLVELDGISMIGEVSTRLKYLLDPALGVVGEHRDAQALGDPPPCVMAEAV